MALDDILFNLGSAALAAVSGLFAVTMVFELQPWWSAAPSPELLARSATDPLVTGSLPSSADTATSYRLLTVIDGIAFVEVAGDSGAEVWSVGVGEHLPGAGTVAGIVRNSSGWQVTTTTRLQIDSTQ